MSNNWRGLHGPITAEDARDEPKDEQLFNLPPRPISPETRALFKRVEVRDVGSEARRPRAVGGSDVGSLRRRESRTGDTRTARSGRAFAQSISGGRTAKGDEIE